MHVKVFTLAYLLYNFLLTLLAKTYSQHRHDAHNLGQSVYYGICHCIIFTTNQPDAAKC